MENFSLETLHSFVVKAKAATYGGGSRKLLLPYRLESRDHQFSEGDWAYHDSYFGNADFIGQEIVYLKRQPVWGLNYYARILRPELVTAAETGAMIMKSLTHMYREGRFLGGFTHQDGDLQYIDTNEGNVAAFRGKEKIMFGDIVVYELLYHGGLLHG